MRPKTRTSDSQVDDRNMSPFSALIKPRGQNLEDQHLSGIAIFVFIVIMLIAVGIAIYMDTLKIQDTTILLVVIPIMLIGFTFCLPSKWRGSGKRVWCCAWDVFTDSRDLVSL